MKTKILGLLAAGLLVGPTAANASYIYNLSSNVNSTAFVLTTASLIDTDTTFTASDFDSITFAGATFDSVKFFDPLTAGRSPTVYFYNGLNQLDGFFWSVSFNGPGTYCSGIDGCDSADAVMTIRESTVPEPGTLALLGLGLAGLGLSRRRKAN